MSLSQAAPVIIVSADSHVGPRLREDLRAYCPARHLDDYDALIAQTGPIVNGQALLGHPNAGPGHYDPAARLADMDSDGVAAEVIYHGSQNGEPLPWGGSAKFGIGTFDAFDSSLLELSELGCDIYDRWLADFCSADPKRLLGLFLTLVITEIEEQWYQSTQWALDSQYRRFGHTPLKKGLPSAYFPTNIYMGASFMSPAQAVEASRDGYAGNVIWGRDYPHMEGAHQAGDFAEPVHLVALRNVMSRVPQHDAVNMAGLNGVRAMGLDGDYLATVAARIGAPTAERLTTPVESFPEVLPLCMAFAGQSGPRPLDKEEMERFTLAPR